MTKELEEGEVITEKAGRMKAVVKCFDDDSVYVRYLNDDGKEETGENIYEYSYNEIEEIFVVK